MDSLGQKNLPTWKKHPANPHITTSSTHSQLEVTKPLPAKEELKYVPYIVAYSKEVFLCNTEGKKKREE